MTVHESSRACQLGVLCSQSTCDWRILSVIGGSSVGVDLAACMPNLNLQLLVKD